MRLATPLIISLFEIEDDARGEVYDPRFIYVDDELIVGFSFSVDIDSRMMDRIQKTTESVGGTDKLFMTIIYLSKLLPSTRLALLAHKLSDVRVLLRYAGLISLFNWIRIFERNPPASFHARWLGRLMNVCNAVYYPCEHAYWLGKHKIIGLSQRHIEMCQLWSVRAWAGYLSLCTVQLALDWKRKGNASAAK